MVEVSKVLGLWRRGGFENASTREELKNDRTGVRSSFKWVFLCSGGSLPNYMPLWFFVWVVRCSYRMQISSCFMFLIFSVNFESLLHVSQWCCGVVIITTAQLHSAKSKLRFYSGSNPVQGVSEIWDDKNLWQWSQLEKMLNAFRQSFHKNNSSSWSWSYHHHHYHLPQWRIDEILNIVCQLPGEGSLGKYNDVVSRLDQSKKYQEILET